MSVSVYSFGCKSQKHDFTLYGILSIVRHRFDNSSILLKDNRCLSDVHSTFVTSLVFTMSRQVHANAWHWGQFVYQIMHFVTVTFQSRKFQSNKIFKALNVNCLKKGSFNYVLSITKLSPIKAFPSFNIRDSENRVLGYVLMNMTL